ncbi:MAG: hypothetical protein VB118_05855 [Oscillospiraceae bacterium]|nr:hypothetical protein [Oscillospiraceae bacterium]
MNILYYIKKKRGVLMIAAVLMIAFLTILFAGSETTDNKTHDTTQTDTLETTATVITDKTSFSDTTNQTTTGSIIDPAETTDTDVQTTQPDTGEETKPAITGKEAEFLSAFRSVYTEAERIYAFYSVYRRIKHGNLTTDIDGMRYDVITEPGLFSLNDLKMLTRKYFNDEFTKSLINTQNIGNHPLFIDYNGALYRIGGYAGQWSYDAVDNDEYEIIELSETDAVVRVTASVDEYDRRYFGSYDFHVTIDNNGNIIFTDFKLLADVLWEVFVTKAETGKEITPLDKEAKLLADFKLVYEKAERVYAFYSGYGLIKHGELSVDIDGLTYLIITEQELHSINDLKTLTRRYFSEAITESLIDTINHGNDPLFINYNGALYRIGGYVGLWTYEVADNEQYELIESSDTDAVVQVSAYTEEVHTKHFGSYDYHVTIDNNGNIIFTDFRLLADVLWHSIK